MKTLQYIGIVLLKVFLFRNNVSGYYYGAMKRYKGGILINYIDNTNSFEEETTINLLQSCWETILYKESL